MRVDRVMMRPGRGMTALGRWAGSGATKTVTATSDRRPETRGFMRATSMRPCLFASSPLTSWIQPMDLPRECDRLPDVRDPADPGDGPLQAQPEAGMDEAAVLPEVQIPLVGGGVESLLPDPRNQLVVVVLALGSADDLPIPLGR